MTRRARLHRDQRGATAAEFALVLPIFLLFLVGLIDVGRYAWAVNQAEKATQIGARWAVVTDMVPSGLSTYSFAVLGGVPQGTPVTTADFDKLTCQSTSGTVSCNCPTGSPCNFPTAVDAGGTLAFARIVARMQMIYPPVTADRVSIDYVNSGLGYSGDPNGPDVAPLVTVRLGKPGNPMSFPMFFMLGRRVPLPSFSYALTLEDAQGTIAN